MLVELLGIVSILQGVVCVTVVYCLASICASISCSLMFLVDFFSHKTALSHIHTKKQVAAVLFGLIHSFIRDISIVPLQVHYYSEALLTTELILCRS